MSTPDSAMLQFVRRCSEYCRAAACGRIICTLEVDFGSLLPEIEAVGRLTVDVEAPLEHWLWPGSVDWRADGRGWCRLPDATRSAAEAVVNGWIARAREQILRMTGVEILSALEGHKSIAVSIDSAGAGRSPGG